jgi:hypothetical protein
MQEGGRYEQYSKGELEALVSAGGPLPAELEQMVTRR